MENIPIERYENLYEVSYDGRVFSKDKEASYKGQSYLKGRELKQELIERRHTNYRRVTLSKNGETKRFLVHRLVANAFILNPKNKPHINHIDNVGENNYYYNLEWCTPSENMTHSYSQGRLDTALENATSAAAVVTSTKARTRWNERIGKVFNDVKLKSIDTYGKHPRGQVECVLCGKDYEVSLETLLMTRKTTGCKSCSLVQTHKNRK